MKNKLILLSLAFVVKLSAQTSFEVRLLSTSALITPNQVVQTISLDEDAVKLTYDVINTSSSAHKYVVKRYNVLKHSYAEATFCFAGQCYDTNTTQSPDTLKLIVGGKASTTMILGSPGTLDVDLSEHSPNGIGKSIIKYTVMEATNHADSMQFVVSYNNAITPVGLKEVADKNVSSLNLFPNPAKENTFLQINSLKGGELELNVFNLLGEAVYTEKVILVVGNNEIKLNTVTYPKGLYFVCLPDGKSVITKKLTIN